MPHQKMNALVVRRPLHLGDEFQMIETQMEALWVDFFSERQTWDTDIILQ